MSQCWLSLIISSASCCSEVLCSGSIKWHVKMLLEGQPCRVSDGLRVSPRPALSQSARLCTLFAQSLHPDHLTTLPIFVIPVLSSRLQPPMQFSWGLMLCLWIGVGLLGQQTPGICAAALCVIARHWEMKRILSLSAPNSPMSATCRVIVPPRY